MIFNATTPSSGGGGSSFEGFRKVDTWDEFHGLLDGADTGNGMILLYNMYRESYFCMVNGWGGFDSLLLSPLESWPFCVNSEAKEADEFYAYSDFDRNADTAYFTLSSARTGDQIYIFLDGDVDPDYTAEYYIRTS